MECGQACRPQAGAFLQVSGRVFCIVSLRYIAVNALSGNQMLADRDTLPVCHHARHKLQV